MYQEIRAHCKASSVEHPPLQHYIGLLFLVIVHVESGVTFLFIRNPIGVHMPLSQILIGCSTLSQDYVS